MVQFIKKNRGFFILLFLLSSSLFFQKLSGAENPPLPSRNTIISHLEKYAPFYTPIVIFFELPPPGSKEKNIKDFAGNLCKNFFPMFSGSFDKTAKERNNDLLPEHITAVYAGDEDNGLLLCHNPCSQEKLIKMIREQFGTLKTEKTGKDILYSSVQTFRQQKSILFMFPAKDLVVFTQNTSGGKRVLREYLQNRKGMNKQVKHILSRRRKNAFIYGALNGEAAAKNLAGIFPAVKNLLSIGFDVTITGENTLSLNITIETRTMEDAQMLSMVFNNYKVMLAGLFASISGRQQGQTPGAKQNPSFPDPGDMIRIKQNNTVISLEIILSPELVPVMQSLFVPGDKSGSKQPY